MTKTEDNMTTEEVAVELRFFERDPLTKRPDPSKPDPHKVHAFAHRHPDFPRPKKRGRTNLYSRAAILKWLAEQPDGGPTKQPTAPSTPDAGARRGPKPKSARAA
jgi:hypothetical protein